MNTYFKKILPDYESVEITCLYLHNKKEKVSFNILTLIELIPTEQEPSLEIGTEETRYLDRENIDETFTVYITRVLSHSLQSGIELFEDANKAFDLKYKGILDTQIQLFEGSLLEDEPSGEYPLIIDKQTEETLGSILPFRNTDFRVWAKFDRKKNWLQTFNEKLRKKFFKATDKLAERHLGLTLSIHPEHCGNVYLFGCNPYIRQYGRSLLDYNKELLILFQEREGKTIVGKKLVIEDKRAGNLGFSIERIIVSHQERISLPNFPDFLVIRIYDSNGYLLENHSGRWLNMSFGMNISHTILNLTYKMNDEILSKKIPKQSAEKPVKIGNYDHSLIYYLKDQQRNKDIEKLARNNEFVFFAGEGKKDKEKARDIISAILNGARARCILLDPYFSAVDIYYAYIISNLSVSVDVISSAAFLRKKTDDSRTKSKASQLLDEVDAYRKHFPAQKIQCKVLKGRSSSPLHDRYIVADDTVYLLGSSFNEFGTRATTLIRIPAPETLIKQALTWWDDNSKTVELSNFVQDLKKEDESEFCYII